uniref:DnaA initiator-associating protein diaA n=1 Tax=Lygus hesperus TaxID=30085 RepID=A0A0A9WF73_LYGHE
MRDWLIICACAATIALSSAHPTIYKRNEDEVLSPVLVAVSSTVIPLPIYKVSTSLTKHEGLDFDGKADGQSGPKLITVKTKKTKKDKIGASVKAITREDWEKKSLIA